MNVQEFWENVHETDDISLLTDSDPNSVYSFHQLQELADASGNTVLEVGIGYGKSIQHLASKNRVIAVDIAESALERVRPFAYQSVLTPDLKRVKRNSVDWALSHLVFQHCTDSMLRKILSGVLRALKPQGFFSFQFADIPPGNIAFSPEHQRLVDLDMLQFRSSERVENIVEKCGGRVISISPKIQFPKVYNIGWYAMRIAPTKD
ncbi:MAG: class I SAM-dependent methyltransferase [Candidatus Thorarchaeota archaeon]|jgi:SAM-dependent methyltransferase